MEHKNLSVGKAKQLNRFLRWLQKQTFDWLTSKQPQASHLVVTDKTEQLFSEITILLYQEVEMIHGLSMQSSEYGKPYNS